jgi:hypothetical protein
MKEIFYHIRSSLGGKATVAMRKMKYAEVAKVVAKNIINPITNMYVLKNIIHPITNMPIFVSKFMKLSD